MRSVIVNCITASVLFLSPTIFALGQQTQPDSDKIKMQSTAVASACDELTSVATERREAFYKLTKAAQGAYIRGDLTGAKTLSGQLLKEAEAIGKDWNCGNAIHVGNLVFGRVALAQGDVKEAGRYLIAAGNTPGSPQLNSFGPDMNLAKDLLIKGERQTVLEYLDLCRKFWKPGEDRLDQWTAEIAMDQMPDFGANLRYYFH